MELSNQMKTSLENAGIPFNRVSVFGSTINIEAPSEGSIKSWRSLLSKIGNVLPAVEVVRPLKGYENAGWGEAVRTKKAWVCLCFIN